LSPNDEFADYEVLTYLLGDPAGRFPHVAGSYIRQALKDGLSMLEARGFNPYKMGFVGGSDSHNTGVPYRQTNFFGGHALNDGDIKQRMSGYVFAGLDVRLENPAGLTGVWAEENTRDSLFDAMQRKETFGTSGPHIKVRFFGSADWTNVANAADWIKLAYAGGVPMGADLPPLPTGHAPSFIVWAVKDPTSGNLDRIQVVKGWTKHGQSFEKVFDVAWAGNRTPDPFTGKIPAIGTTVNLADATYTNTIGSVELKGVWTDPEFDPSLDAFYYLRTLEIPTPRWTTIQAHELGIAPPSNVAATVQERAWSSPIWYTPSKEIRDAAAKGTTVADLNAKGATALDDDALTKLIVGQTTWVKNTVTGEVFSIAWTQSGQRLISNVEGGIPQPSEVGDVLHGGLTGQGTAYAIKNGAIVTTLDNTAYEVKVYKVGDKYMAARNNEFGFVNYEVVPTPTELDPVNQQKPPF
jgi:hypothetical protein